MSPSFRQSQLTPAAAVRGFKARTLVPGLLTPACLLVAAQATAQVNYAVSGSTAYVVGGCTSGNIVIASTFNGYPVTGIAANAFDGCTRLTNVTMPNSVTNIGDYAFSGCTNLTSVTIGNNVTNIGDGAFSYCSSLTSVTIPDSVTGIGQQAFWQCTSLTNVIIGNSVKGIGYGSFSQCTSLTSVIIGNGVISIGGNAFFGCTSLTSVMIPNSVANIGGSVFSRCTSLTNLSVEAANPAYGSLDGVLFDKAQTSLIAFPPGRGGSYVIPNSVTSIGTAFSVCTSLASVTIPNSVTSIVAGAFYGCTSLTSVTIGNGVTSIGEAAFFSCTSLTSVTIPNSVTNISGNVFYDCTSLTSVIIGNGVTGIGGGAFSHCTRLPSVSIPDSVTNISNGVFYDCTSLTNLSVDAANPAYSSLNGILFNKTQTTLITFPAGLGGGYVIPNSVTSIMLAAFYLSTNLTSVTMGNSVTNIGDEAFLFCTSLTSVTMGNSVSRIGTEAFGWCISLTNLTFLGNAPFLDILFHSVDAGATVYYYYGTTGWGRTYGGLPTLMLGAPAPRVGTASAGVQPGGFGFILGGVTNQTIVVEASSNLSDWQPIWTNTLPGASADFVDPEWLHHSNRFYRARSD